MKNNSKRNNKAKLNKINDNLIQTKLKIPKKIVKRGENLTETAPNNKNKKINNKKLKNEHNLDLDNLSKQKNLPQNVKTKTIKEPTKSILKKAAQNKMQINQHTNQNACKTECTTLNQKNLPSREYTSEGDSVYEKDNLPMFSHQNNYCDEQDDNEKVNFNFATPKQNKNVNPQLIKTTQQPWKISNLNDFDSDESIDDSEREYKQLRIPEWALTHESIMKEIEPQLNDPSVYEKHFGRINPQNYTLVSEDFLESMFQQGKGLNEVKYKRINNVTDTSQKCNKNWPDNRDYIQWNTFHKLNQNID